MPKKNWGPTSKYCLNCNSTKLRTFKARAFDSKTPSFVEITECKDCCFAWQYPLGRSEEQSVLYFETAYADKGQATTDYFDEDKKREIAELEFDFISSLPVKDKTLLDIGAGAGIFAEIAAEHNWNVTAIDPAIDVTKFNNKPRIKAIKGFTHQIPMNRHFDVVTLWDVIEHATSPIEIINNAKQYINDGGWLVIETGNYKSANRVSGGKNHWVYQLDHKWYFSPESIEKTLKDAGFSDLIFANKVLRPGWNGDTDYAGPSRSNLLKEFVKSPLQLPAQLSRYYWLRRARKWRMSGIDIFTVAARVIK